MESLPRDTSPVVPFCRSTPASVPRTVRRPMTDMPTKATRRPVPPPQSARTPCPPLEATSSAVGSTVGIVLLGVAGRSCLAALRDIAVSETVRSPSLVVGWLVRVRVNDFLTGTDVWNLGRLMSLRDGIDVVLGISRKAWYRT